MAEMTDEGWEKLHTASRTRRLLEAMGELDMPRGTLGDDGCSSALSKAVMPLPQFLSPGRGENAASTCQESSGVT